MTRAASARTLIALLLLSGWVAATPTLRLGLILRSGVRSVVVSP